MLCCCFNGLNAYHLTFHPCFPVSSVPGSAARIQVTGEVGGSATFRCPSDEQQKLEYLYLQRGSKLVNGYHASKEIQTFQENTTFNLKERTVDVHGLKVSDSGPYDCHTGYSSGSQRHDIIDLSVTGEILFVSWSKFQLCYLALKHFSAYTVIKYIQN